MPTAGLFVLDEMGAADDFDGDSVEGVLHAGSVALGEIHAVVVG